MQIVSSTDASKKFGEMVRLAQKGPVVVQNGTNPVAALISISDLERFQKFTKFETVSDEAIEDEVRALQGSFSGMFGDRNQIDQFIRDLRDE